MPTYPSLHAPLPQLRVARVADKPRPASTPERGQLPSEADLAARGLAFERVHPAHEQPVRLRQHGHALGVFATPAGASALIRQLSLLVIIAGTLLVQVPGHAAEGGPFPSAAFLAAVAEVEDWRGRPGAAGEIGPWQMRPRVWAVYHGTAGQRAEQHLAWLRAQLARRGVDASPFNLALCWNAGLHAATTGRAPERSYDYARRVVAIMETKR